MSEEVKKEETAEKQKEVNISSTNIDIDDRDVKRYLERLFDGTGRRREHFLSLNLNLPTALTLILMTVHLTGLANVGLLVACVPVIALYTIRLLFVLIGGYFLIKMGKALGENALKFISKIIKLDVDIDAPKKEDKPFK